MKCLNCGADLSGPFCAHCGQRDVPAYPSVREFIGDAWEEISGWDGRFARTLVLLLRRPHQLTVETLEGRRARYVRPLRLYLVASLVYFLVAALVPDGTAARQQYTGQGVKVNLLAGETLANLTPEQRERARQSAADSPWWIRPMVESLLADPKGFQNRVMSAFPRLLFVLVPVVAALLAVFYRRRPFMQHLTFSLHTHAFIFIVLTVAALVSLPGWGWLDRLVSLLAIGIIVAYVLRALRGVYGGGWGLTVAKAAAVAVLYFIVWVPGMVLMLAWATLTT